MEASYTFQQTRKADDFCCDWHIYPKYPIPLLLNTGILILILQQNSFLLFCRLLIFSKSTFSKNSFRNTECQTVWIQIRHFVGPDLGPNCMQRLLVDDTRRQRVIKQDELRSFHCLTLIHPFQYLGSEGTYCLFTWV